MDQKDSKMRSYLEKAVNTLLALQHPGALREFFTSKAFSVPCHQLNAAVKQYQPYFATILDVGANIGQFALAATLYFPDAKIYSFEPVPDVFRVLQENINKNPNIQAFNCALGNHQGQIPFHRNEYTRLSSALQIDKNNDNVRYNERMFSTINVSIHKLDEFYAHMDIQHPVLLKIDVQGMELDVLSGGSHFLDKVDFILCEAALEGLYDNQPLFDEIDHFISRLGYKLIAPLYLNRGKGGRVIEMDVLYQKQQL
jgi:FkbM family methyltransferase